MGTYFQEFINEFENRRNSFEQQSIFKQTFENAERRFFPWLFFDELCHMAWRHGVILLVLRRRRLGHGDSFGLWECRKVDYRIKCNATTELV